MIDLTHLRTAVDEVAAAAVVAEDNYTQALANYTTLDASYRRCVANRAVITDELLALQGRYDTLKTAFDILKSPSGELIPTADLPGWKLAWSEDFNTDCPEGGFTAAYPAIDSYPSTYKDTSKRGVYDTGIVSVAGSVARKWVHTDLAGSHRVAALVPKLGLPLGGKWGDVAGGRFAVRFRADRLPTYKVAWLLWPQSNHSLPDGEIDFPECALADDTIRGYMHRQGATVGGDQFALRTAANPGDWHTCVIEWRMGQSLAFFLDGVQQGLTLTAQVPATPMHWVLQTETTLDKTVPIVSSAAGNVEIDWLAYWAPA